MAIKNKRYLFLVFFITRTEKRRDFSKKLCENASGAHFSNRISLFLAHTRGLDNYVFSE